MEILAMKLMDSLLSDPIRRSPLVKMMKLRKLQKVKLLRKRLKTPQVQLRRGLEQQQMQMMMLMMNLF
jgi:hypothetical protein